MCTSLVFSAKCFLEDEKKMLLWKTRERTTQSDFSHKLTGQLSLPHTLKRRTLQESCQSGLPLWAGPWLRAAWQAPDSPTLQYCWASPGPRLAARLLRLLVLWYPDPHFSLTSWPCNPWPCKALLQPKTRLCLGLTSQGSFLLPTLPFPVKVACWRIVLQCLHNWFTCILDLYCAL